jgi:hypothetical protein
MEGLMNRVLPFHTHAARLHAWSARNFGRFKMKTGPFSHPDPRERARLQREQLEEKTTRPTDGGTSVMGRFLVAQASSRGDKPENLRRGPSHRQTRTSGDEVESTRMLKFVSRVEHLAWRERWRNCDGSSSHGRQRNEAPSFDETKRIGRLMQGWS